MNNIRAARVEQQQKSNKMLQFFIERSHGLWPWDVGEGGLGAGGGGHLSKAPGTLVMPILLALLTSMGKTYYNSAFKCIEPICQTSFRPSASMIKIC